MKTATMDVSIVIPLFNEEESVGPLSNALIESLNSVTNEVEIILVDDGSTDDTFVRASEFARADQRFRVIKLTRNFGQTAALYAGFEAALGDVIVTMDGDLQNDPRDIEKFVEKIHEGYDLVTGWRKQRKDPFITRKIPSYIANWGIQFVANSPIRDNGCAMRAYRAESIKQFPMYSEMHRLLPTMLTLAGARIAQLEVRHHARKYGRSKYGLSRIYKVIFDLIALKMILTSDRNSLFGFGITSLFFSAISAIGLLACMIRLIYHPQTTIVVPLGASMLFGILSIALFMLGILCRLIYSRGKFKAESLLHAESF